MTLQSINIKNHINYQKTTEIKQSYEFTRNCPKVATVTASVVLGNYLYLQLYVNSCLCNMT